METGSEKTQMLELTDKNIEQLNYTSHLQKFK